MKESADDRGAVAVLVALCLVVLIGFAAIAVDSGIAYSDRRQQQSAADVGALAAVQFAKTTLATSHPNCTGLSGKSRAACRGAQEALAVIDGTLPGRYNSAAWAACSDPNDDSQGYTQNSFISDCISFTNSLRRARVLLPGTDVDTAFGRVIGFDSISVGAFAEAGLEFNLSGGVLPFALGPSGAGSNHACFFAQSTSNLNVYPCDGPAGGNFGKLDIRWYGNEEYNAGAAQCTGSTQWRMSINIITGTDHPMEIHNGSTVNDVANCNIIANPVNQVDTQTGNSAGAIADGLFSGVSGFEGRLLCKDGSEGYPAFNYVSSGAACVTINNSHPGALDHTPLWHFLAWNNAACNGSINDRAGMEACLVHYRNTNPTDGSGNPVPLFNDDLAGSTRFGAVPELHANPGGGSGSYNITGFKPVYLETIYLKCNATTCDVAHSPGEPSSGICPDPITPTASSCGWNSNGNKGVEALTAFILTRNMLPDSIDENFPWDPGTLLYNLYR